MQSTFEKKLTLARQELKMLMTNWRKEWQDAVVKWSDKISILPLKKDSNVTTTNTEAAVFPTDYNTDYFLNLDKKREYNLDDVAYYYEYYAHQHLSAVPINLAAIVYRHFVLAFGGRFSATFVEHIQQYNYRSHYFLAKNVESYKRHRKFIHTLLADPLIPLSSESSSPSAPTESSAPSSTGESDEFDGWEVVQLQGIRLDDQLGSSHYVEPLLWELKAYQMNEVIKHQFRSDGRGPQLVKNAQEFLGALNTMAGNGTWDIGLCDDTFSILLLREAMSRGALRNSRESLKDFNLDCDIKDNDNDRIKSGADCWKAALENPEVVKFLGNLTVADVSFIIRVCIDAECDANETREKIKNIERADEKTASFPDTDDHFTDFNFPHLRGVLAESVLSSKLAAYKVGLDEIIDGEFAEQTPSALVSIAAGYLSV